MTQALWTITKHVALCCTLATASRRASSKLTGDAQARRLRALGDGGIEYDASGGLARWYGLTDGEPLPPTSRSRAIARPRSRVRSLEL